MSKPGYFLRIDEEMMKEYDIVPNSSKETMDMQFNICLGLEPMKENVFQYFIKDTLRKLDGEGYLSMYYYPKRSDNVTGIQATRSMFDGYIVEILMEFDDGVAYHSFSKDMVSFKETLRLFRNVLVDFNCPDVTEWYESTELYKTEWERRMKFDEKEG